MKQHVMITGANRGLGRAFVDHYLDRCWSVTALVRSRQSEGAVAIERLGATLIEADLSGQAARHAVAEQMAATEAPLDLLINNAGPPAATAGMGIGADEEALVHFQTHCLGVLRVVQAVRPNLQLASGALVVNISSRLGSISRMAQGMYADIHHSLSYPVAKAAQNMLTVQLHRLLSPQGVRVVAVHPGALLTGYGSTDAATPVQEGARRLAALFETLAPDCSGVFLDPDGDTLPW